MRTSPHLGLRIWDQLLDDYNHEQLADNWAKIDFHDHSPGRGVLIPTEGIANEAITEPLLATEVSTRLGLLYKSHTGAATLKSGELAVQEESGKTFTLPVATTVNQRIGIFSNVAETKIKTSGGAKIYGDFVEGATEVILLKYQHLQVQSNATNWLIIAGEPRREQRYKTKTFSKTEMEAGQELSPTREAVITVSVSATAIIEIGGMGLFNIGENTTASYCVPPGQIVKMTQVAAMDYILR